jgi:hypothetical protein
MYGSLLQPSCDPTAGFSRAALLSDEMQAVAAFEQSLGGRWGSDHIQIAKADAELAEGCWADDDPRFARIHVAMTKEQVARSLEHMRRLAPRLRYLPLNSVSASEGAQFRLRSRQLFESINPLCDVASGVSNDQIFAAARQRVRRFAFELTGSDFAAHFDIAERDVEFDQSTVVVECAAPRELELAVARREVLTDVERRLAELDSIARP